MALPDYCLPYLELKNRFYVLRDKYAVLFDQSKPLYLSSATTVWFSRDDITQLWQDQLLVSVTVDIRLNCLYGNMNPDNHPDASRNIITTRSSDHFQPSVSFQVDLRAEFWLRDDQGNLVGSDSQLGLCYLQEHGIHRIGSDREVLRIRPQWSLRQLICGHLDEDGELDYCDREVVCYNPKLTKLVQQAKQLVAGFELAEPLFLSRLADYQDFFFDGLNQLVMELQFYPEVFLDGVGTL